MVRDAEDALLTMREREVPAANWPVGQNFAFSEEQITFITIAILSPWRDVGHRYRTLGQELRWT